MMAKYLDPFSDYGFNRIFANEVNKHVLLDFLNSILPAVNKINTISFSDKDLSRQIRIRKPSSLIIYCKSDNGDKFIVELQQSKYKLVKDTDAYFNRFTIMEEAEIEDWHDNFTAIFLIGILDFTFVNPLNKTDNNEVVCQIKLPNQNDRLFQNRLTCMLVVIPNFTKTENEVLSQLDKWLFFLKHVEDFKNIPSLFINEVVFCQAIEDAALSNLNKFERESYEICLKNYRDLKGFIDYAFMKGQIAGRKNYEENMETEAAKEVAKQMLKAIEPVEKILKYTLLNITDIEKIKFDQQL